MNVLSLFDGMSCGQLALQRSGIQVNKYYASEIKKAAIKVTQYNFPNTIQLGDVMNSDNWNIEKPDLIIFGSPCQDLSQASRQREGLKGSRSSLFFQAHKILNHYKPKYFLMENVGRMKEEDKNIISEMLGVQPIRINSKLVSGQLRDRNYWTNIPNVTQPEDKGITFQSIITDGYVDREKARALLEGEARPYADLLKFHRRYTQTGFGNLIFSDPSFDPHKGLRLLNQLEMERLQTVPEGYTKCLSRNGAASVLGDGWTIDVIAHIFKNIKEVNNV